MPDTDIRTTLQGASSYLSSSGADTPYLDACLLLSEALGIEKEQLFARLADPLSIDQRDTFQSLLSKRAAGVPVSYLRKRKEFYGLDFFVDDRVLVPRPDTEVIVETVFELVEKYPDLDQIHDSCTGSGCIAIALAHLHPGITVSASDISSHALEVFHLNSRRHLTRAPRTYVSDLLEDVPGRFDIIVSNPPYLLSTEVDSMMAAGWPEPRLALDGGVDGLNLVRRLADQATRSLRHKGYLLMEVADLQMDAVVEIFEASGYREIEVKRDLAGRRRVCVGRNGVR